MIIKTLEAITNFIPDSCKLLCEKGINATTRDGSGLALIPLLPLSYVTGLVGQASAAGYAVGKYTDSIEKTILTTGACLLVPPILKVAKIYFR